METAVAVVTGPIMPHCRRRGPGLSRRRVHRSPIVADQPDAMRQRCDLIALAVLQILAARSKVSVVTGEGLLVELAAGRRAAETTPAPVSTLFLRRRSLHGSSPKPVSVTAQG